MSLLDHEPRHNNTTDPTEELGVPEIVAERPRTQIDDRGHYQTLPNPDTEFGYPEGPNQDFVETTFTPDTPSKRRRKVVWGAAGAAAVGLALGVGAALGVKGGGEAKAPPVAEAPATPPAGAGEATPPATAETPLSEAETIALTRSWNETGKVPLYFDGKKYEGTAAFTEAIQVSASKYPTAEDAVRGLIERANTQVNYGIDPEHEKEYRFYRTPSGSAYGSLGIAEAFVDDSFDNALLDPELTPDDLPQGTTTDLSELLKKWHENAISASGNDPNSKVEISIDDSKFDQPLTHRGIHSVTVPVILRTTGNELAMQDATDGPHEDRFTIVGGVMLDEDTNSWKWIDARIVPTE